MFVFGSCCLTASVLARPHILALPCLELWTAGLLIARALRDAAPPLRLLPVTALWANLHPDTAASALALLLPLDLEAQLANPASSPGRRTGSRFALAATAAALLTPYGWHTLATPFRVLSLHHLANIGEWRSLDFTTPQPLEVALAALLYVCAHRACVRLPPVRLLLLLGLLHLALQHIRHGLLR